MGKYGYDGQRYIDFLDVVYKKLMKNENLNSISKMMDTAEVKSSIL
jgi:hypothetical protein